MNKNKCLNYKWISRFLHKQLRASSACVCMYPLLDEFFGGQPNQYLLHINMANSKRKVASGTKTRGKSLINTHSAEDLCQRIFPLECCHCHQSIVAPIWNMKAQHTHFVIIHIVCHSTSHASIVFNPTGLAGLSPWISKSAFHSKDLKRTKNICQLFAFIRLKHTY